MYTSNSPICLLTLVKLRVGDLYVMPLALVYFMKIGALKAMIFFNDVKEICWYYLRIWVKLFTVKVHKNVLGVFEFRENRCSESRVLVLSVFEFRENRCSEIHILLLSVFEFRENRCSEIRILILSVFEFRENRCSEIHVLVLSVFEFRENR